MPCWKSPNFSISVLPNTELCLETVFIVSRPFRTRNFFNHQTLWSFLENRTNNRYPFPIIVMWTTVMFPFLLPDYPIIGNCAVPLSRNVRCYCQNWYGTVVEIWTMSFLNIVMISVKKKRNNQKKTGLGLKSKNWPRTTDILSKFDIDILCEWNSHTSKSLVT